MIFQYLLFFIYLLYRAAVVCCIHGCVIKM